MILQMTCTWDLKMIVTAGAAAVMAARNPEYAQAAAAPFQRLAAEADHLLPGAGRHPRVALAATAAASIAGLYYYNRYLPRFPNKALGPHLRLLPPLLFFCRACGCRPTDHSLWGLESVQLVACCPVLPPVRHFATTLLLAETSYCAMCWATSLWHPGFDVCIQYASKSLIRWCTKVPLFWCVPPPAHASLHDLCRTCRHEISRFPWDPSVDYAMC